MRGWQLDYVRNITDIDDKILRRASENGEAFDVLSARFIEAMHEDERALGNIPPDREPRATAHIGEIIAITARLVERGFAYRAANGNMHRAVSYYAGGYYYAAKRQGQLERRQAARATLLNANAEETPQQGPDPFPTPR